MTPGVAARALAFLIAVLAAAAPLRAQEAPFAGRVLGPDGESLAGIPVALHRVTDAGAGFVEEATSDAAGAFVIDAGTPDADALYFVTARWGGELYVGPAFRPPFPADAEYVIQVGIPEASASAIAAGAAQAQAPPRPPPSPSRAADTLLLILALLGVATAAILVVQARRPPLQRRLLIRLAELEEALDADAQDGEARVERERVRERLRALDAA
jgi:hypothetical protein